MSWENRLLIKLMGNKLVIKIMSIPIVMKILTKITQTFTWVAALSAERRKAVQNKPQAEFASLVVKAS